MIKLVRSAYCRYRWRQRRKAGRSIRIRVADPARYLRALDGAGVRCAVMRWYDEVPVDATAARGMPGDVDVIIDDHAAGAASWIAAGMPGDAAVEFRSVTGEMGAFSGLPYYPPVRASEVLDERVHHERGFPIPSRAHRMALLLFHLCYQKAERSGIPTGVDLPTGEAKRDYAAKLIQFAREEGATLPDPLTLQSIHEHLASIGWEMQLDLLVRWPVRTPWIEHLAKVARARYDDVARHAPDLIVFVLRSDVTDDLRALALERLGSWFEILEHGPLDADQRERCERHLRGGNWYRRRGRHVSGPVHAIIAHDPTPEPVTDPELLRAQPHMTNARVSFKTRLRVELREAAAAAGVSCRHGLHSSDNQHEAMHFLEVLFAGRFESKVHEFARRIDELRRGHGPGPDRTETAAEPRDLRAARREQEERG